MVDGMDDHRSSCSSAPIRLKYSVCFAAKSQIATTGLQLALGVPPENSRRRFRPAAAESAEAGVFAGSPEGQSQGTSRSGELRTIWRNPWIASQWYELNAWYPLFSFVVPAKAGTQGQPTLRWRVWAPLSRGDGE
jgi:hypothetical protein